MSVPINKIFALNLIITVILIIISISVSIVESNNLFNINIQERLILYIILYSNLISISYFIVINISKFISAIILMIRYKFFEINSMGLQDLGHIEYLIVDNEDLIKHKNLKINSIFVKESAFFRNEDIKNDFDMSSRENLIESGGKITNLTNENVYFDSLKKNLSIEETAKDFIDFFACALFTSLILITNLEMPTQENEKIIKLSRNMGITLKNVSGKFYVFSCYKTEKEFLHLANFSNKELNFVLVSDAIQSRGIIYLKSSINLQNSKNYEDSSFGIDSNNYLPKYKAYHFYKASLNRDEIEQFSYDYNLALNSSLNSNGKIFNLFKSYSKNLECLGCANFDYEKHKSIRRTLTDLQNSGVKTWIVSSNNQKDALLASYSCKMFKNSTNVRYLEGATDVFESLEIMNKILNEENIQEKKFGSELVLEQKNNHNHLSSVKDEEFNQVGNHFNLKSARSFHTIRRNKTLRSLMMKNRVSSKIIPNFKSRYELKSLSFSLVIDSQFLDIALSSEASRKILCLLFHISESICFYRLSPDHKRSLVRLLKKNFKRKPCIMAVGNGFSDSGMLEEADISIIIKKERDNSPYFKPNIIVRKFSDLKNLILVEGQFFNIRFSKLIQFSLFKETMICILIFLYQINSNWSAYQVVSMEHFFIFELLTGLIPLLIIGLTDKDCKENTYEGKDCISNRELDVNGFLKDKVSTLRCLLYIFLGAFQGFVIYIITTISFCGVISSNGYTDDNEMRSTLIFMLLSLSLLTITLISSRHFYLPGILSAIISLLFIKSRTNNMATECEYE